VCLLALALANASAEEAPKYGSIEVLSEASGARVYIEGFLAGEAPVTVEQVVPGTYRVVAKKDSFDDFLHDVQVTAGEISKVEVRLTPDTGAWESPVRGENDWIPILDKDKRKYEKAKSTKRFRDYKVLEISNFLMKSDEEVPPDHLYALMRDLVTKLDEKTQFKRFATDYTTAMPSPSWIESSGGPEEPALVLSGVITRYQRGSRAKRYFVGFGAGKSRIYCLFRFVDKESGEVLLERMENGSVSMGLFGGASAGAMEELASDIAKVIKKNW
jgi:hypothetical protein